ncbi:similar to Saccharomyces cerevisiae YER058W PET117 Protein required for assembly of cytochrome c oxidase [Maudiozyma saulgeensis]|uniref:Similar to Saccharomyces cerevisiae YER058W PET117 Protein required for assembly of cytochrome c oxidase n=1 Tax=Maudiozyma saulgeensis TaxID=1789683 RepID=A0A1X7R2Y1_9SACH|nr:similar to Saccharomyces cerevisiae YER058W PET117 Protein required for assembly of cytochrome c oxidase [Kazachstania saulgeensis]
MSRASKITFALSCVFCVTTVIGVHIVQDMERDTLHQGPIKDAKRVAEKKAAKEKEEQKTQKGSPIDNLNDAAKQKKRDFNRNDHEFQQALKEKYTAIQPLTGEIITQDGEIVKSKK